VLRGLHYAHGLRQHGQPLRIVHRDVSPQNVIVSVSGEVKLADFGIARSALHSTAGTHIKGKLRYMPPEQLEGLPLSGAADLYAVGVMFHELVSNAPYRRGRSVEELCKEITMGEIPELEPALPDELEAMRRRFLAREPEERFASAAEALRAFEDWPPFRDRTFRVAELCERHAKRGEAEEIDEAEGAATQPGAAPARVSTEPARMEALVREPARSRWPIAAVGGLLISAAAVLAAWRPWERDPPAPNEPAVSASAEPKVREKPVVEPPVAAPEVEPAPIEVAKEETIEPTPPVEPTPAPEAKRDRKPKQRRTHENTTPPPDAKVIASLRNAARSGCRAREGETSIEIEFLIEADGRPALPRSSAPGDARSKCIEQRLRNARFAPGAGRRGSVTVTFDP
jgi:hypothetical protein